MIDIGNFKFLIPETMILARVEAPEPNRPQDTK